MGTGRICSYLPAAVSLYMPGESVNNARIQQFWNPVICDQFLAQIFCIKELLLK